MTTGSTSAERPTVFGGDAKMIIPMLDRRTHRCDIIETGDEAWRSNA